MHLHQVVIVPSLGHSSDEGEYDRGRVVGRTSEIDVIDGYLLSLCDELDIEDIRWTMIDTRSRPGVRVSDRAALITPGSLVIHCSSGWSERTIKTGRNHSQVSYSQDTSYQVADEIGESITQWGHCYAFGHKTANPKKIEDPLLMVPGTKGIMLEPFLLNGPDADNYLKRLPELGVAIARCLAEHLRSRGQAARGARVTA